MEVRVADVKKWAGREETVEFEEAPWAEMEARLGARPSGLVHVTARVRNTGGSILVDVAGTTAVEMECARCLAPIVVPLAFSETQEYRELAPGPDDDWVEYANDAIVLDDLVADAAAVAVPIAPLCRPGCRGLCPVCGADWNHERCTCRPPADPRWAALAGWASDSSPETPDDHS